MKKTLSISLCMLLIASLFVSCGGKKTETVEEPVKTEATVATPAKAETPAPAITKEAEPVVVKDEGTVFRIANGAEPQSLDPTLIQGDLERRLNMALFEGLVGTDPVTNNAVPGLAKTWESNEEGTQWTFHLRKENWSDGTPITANDVVYSWLRELNPKTAAPYAWFPCMFIKGASEYNNGDADSSVVGIRALDDYTFQLDLIGPIPYSLNALNHYAFGIVPKHAIEKWGDTWTTPEHFVGNGPFILSARVPQSYIECTPNPEYWDKDAVKLDKVVFYSSDDNNTNYNMFVNGELDWDTNVPKDNIAQASMRDDFISYAELGTYYYDFNNNVAPFNNALLRRAFSLAIDRKALVEGVTKGGEIPAYGMVPPMAGYEALEAPYDNYDDALVEAQNLMAEAGYPDGLGLDPITVLYNTNDGHKAVAEFIQQELKEKLGVNIVLENEEWSTFITDKRNGNFILARDGWIGDYQDPNTFLDMFITGAAMNGCQYSSEQYDTLINGAARMPAGESRFGVLKTADDLISQQDNAIMPLYYYVSNNMIDMDKWGGWYSNTMDIHPVKDIYLK